MNAPTRLAATLAARLITHEADGTPFTAEWDGEVYQVSLAADRRFTLVHTAKGESYCVDFGDEDDSLTGGHLKGMRCDCADFFYRRGGFTALPCKHQKAIEAADDMMPDRPANHWSDPDRDDADNDLATAAYHWSTENRDRDDEHGLND